MPDFDVAAQVAQQQPGIATADDLIWSTRAEARVFASAGQEWRLPPIRLATCRRGVGYLPAVRPKYRHGSLASRAQGIATDPSAGWAEEIIMPGAWPAFGGGASCSFDGVRICNGIGSAEASSLG